MSPLVLAVLGTTVLLGVTLLWTTLADRRRQALQQRLKGVVATTRSQDDPAPTLTLRRRMSRRSKSLHQLPAFLWAKLEAEFIAAGNSIGLLHLIGVGLIAAIVAFGFTTRLLDLSAITAMVLSGLAAPVAAITVLRLYQARYRRKFLDVFPDALDLVCRAVRAGLPANEAMSVAARDIADPVGSELRLALSEMQIGVEPDEALHKVADRTRVPDFRFYVVALSLQRRTGGSLAETLTNLSNVIRARKALRLKAQALSAEAKASAVVLALLPFVVTALLYLFNPTLMSVLFTEARGRFMLGVASGTLATGVVVMITMIRRALR